MDAFFKKSVENEESTENLQKTHKNQYYLMKNTRKNNKYHRLGGRMSIRYFCLTNNFEEFLLQITIRLILSRVNIFAKMATRTKR